MKVLLRAPLLSLSGYGVHARQIFKWLLTRNLDTSVQIVPWGICTYLIDPELEDGLIGEAMRRSTSTHTSFDVSVQVQLPDEWDANLAKTNIGVTAGVETDICSREWVEACKKMNLVIVPSNFTKQTFVRSGVPESKIVVIPEHYNVGEQETEPASILKKNLEALPTEFNFLIFGQVTGLSPETDRKNTFFGLKWLAEVFKDDPDVGIVLKTNMGRHTTIDRLNSTRMLQKVVNEVKKGPYPRFYLAHGMLDTGEISGLYSASNTKALVAPTRGEGWGLTIIDAAASGLPVIATGYSGHMDFMSKVKFINVGYKMAPVHPSKIDGRVFVEGCRWVDVDEKDFKKKVKKFKDSNSLPKKWAEEGALKIRDEYSPRSVFEIYDKALSPMLGE